MLWETLERVNRLRQEALANPDFVQSAQDHEETLKQVEQYFEPTQRRKAAKRAKTLADIYQQTEFGENPSGVQH
ncbi:hypothetical protein [Vibrio anguillarum]|uniref:hypothetical protein n=1 Tax=Vibrio anguillarum TaxID=55601 RepID=UPI001C9BF549|nr:hypothetical protein [Vibrio anguillarum]MBY7665858.1 hypothetical protein [Vibrio anguillarum]